MGATTRLALAGVRGHLLRFLLTACAVMLGVSFVAGTYVLRDSIDNTLQGLFTQASKGVDVQVRAAAVGADSAASTMGEAASGSLPITLERELAAVPGVARAIPDVQGMALIAGKDGTAVRNGGAPGLGFAYHDDDPSFRLVAGRAPSGPAEVVLEQSTLSRSGLVIGDRTRAVIGSQVRPVTVTGEVVFGSMFGATALLLDDASARAAFVPDGRVRSFTITGRDGVTQEVLRDRIAAVLPTGSEAVTGTALAEESRTALQSGLGFFTTFLLVFAGVALFVGMFIVVNTFSIMLGQRTRELALLRAIGASRRQIMAMVLGEAFVIGLLGSGLGIGLGIAVAAGAKALIRVGMGADVGSGLPVHVSTVVTAIVVGVLVTLISALVPARRAARTAPVAAMRDDQVLAPRSLRLRGSIGTAMVLAGLGSLAFAVTRTDPIWPLAGVGAVGAVVGALVAAPLTTRPVVRVVAWPFARLAGAVGRLARENALRLPRRTALTAGSLMIGLALITGLSVVAQSVKASVADTVESEFTSTYVLSAGQAPIPSGVAVATRKVPQVSSVATISGVDVTLDGERISALATQGAALADSFRVTMVGGSLAALDAGDVLVSKALADRNGWTLGERVSVAAGNLTARSSRIGGIYQQPRTTDAEVLVGEKLYLEAVPAQERGDYIVYVKATEGADLARLRADLAALVSPYLVVSVQDGSEYTAEVAGQVDIMLNLLYVLLLFSVIVAVLGIVNTLALSVVERTREIGLLRAVGLGRRQLAGMITIESVATAVFGAVLGAVLGLGLGTAMQRGMRSEGLDILSIPWTSIGLLLAGAGVVGVLAAVLPSVRAVRMNVLQAIATE